MTDREKLIELLEKHEYQKHYPSTLAAILLANGVTFATDNHVGGKWIPVTERLPERDGRYLCVKRIGKSGSVYVQIMNGDSYGFSMGHIYTDDVTHWMPLPEPPMRKGENG